MNKKQTGFLIIFVCMVALGLFLYLNKHSDDDKQEIKILWVKYGLELQKLEDKINVVDDNINSYELSTQLKMFIKRYYNTRNDSDTYSDSMYQYKSEDHISKSEIKQLNYSGLYFGSYYSNFYQDITNYQEIISGTSDKNLIKLNCYFDLFISYYEYKVKNYNNSFKSILENEIVLLQYINLMSDWLLEVK